MVAWRFDDGKAQPQQSRRLPPPRVENRSIFEADALPTLHALTHGIARQINRLCDLALLIGFAEERRTIGAAQLEAVSQELVAVVPE